MAPIQKGRTRAVPDQSLICNFHLTCAEQGDCSMVHQKNANQFGFIEVDLGVSINLAHIVGAKVLWERVGGKQEYAGIAISSSDGKETTVKGNEQLAKMLQLTTAPEEDAS